LTSTTKKDSSTTSSLGQFIINVVNTLLSGLSNRADKEKSEFYKKKMKHLKEVRDDMIHEIAKIDALLKTVNEDINHFSVKINEKKERERKEREKKAKEQSKLKEKEKEKDKDKKKSSGNNSHKIFGLTLQQLTELDGCQMPKFVQACIDFISKQSTLQTEGIFRISVQSVKLDELQRIVEETGNYDFNTIPICEDPFLVPCLMKKFFREMQDPLFTFDCYTCFISASGVENLELRMKKYRDVINMFLPEQNRMILKKLFDFLFEVQRYSEYNKMSYGNLGTCFGPSLLRDSQDFDPMTESLIISQIVAEIIENKDYLFSPPDS